MGELTSQNIIEKKGGERRKRIQAQKERMILIKAIITEESDVGNER